MFKDLFVNLQRQNLRAAQSRCLRVAFLCLFRGKNHTASCGVSETTPKALLLRP